MDPGTFAAVLCIRGSRRGRSGDLDGTEVSEIEGGNGSARTRSAIAMITGVDEPRPSARYPADGVRANDILLLSVLDGE